MGETSDIVIVGSGMGGATCAAGLAPSGARSSFSSAASGCRARAETRDPRAIFSAASFAREETWIDGAGRAVQPGQLLLCRRQHQVLRRRVIRYRAEDFAADRACRRRDARLAVRLRRRSSPGTARRGALSGARRARPGPDRAAAFDALSIAAGAGRAGDRRGAPAHGARRPHAVLAADWASTSTLAERAARRRGTPFPTSATARCDAESGGLGAALAHPNVAPRNRRAGRAARADAGGRRIEGVEVIASAARPASSRQTRRSLGRRGQFGGAAAALGRQGGLANRAGSVGRHFMNHNASAVLAVDPRVVNDSVYQKTLGMNDFYFADGARRAAARQHASCWAASPARSSRPTSKAAPEWSLLASAAHAVDWYAHERRSAQPRQPRHRRRRGRSISIGSAATGRPTRLGRRDCASGCARRATRSCWPAPSTAARRRTSAARCSIGADPSDGAARSLLPGLGPRQPVRRRRVVPADVGGGQPGAHASPPRRCASPTTSSTSI